MGGSAAASAGRVALKEGAEEVVERAAREKLEEAGEKVAKEGGEALAKKTGKELIESLGDDAGDIAKVVTKEIDELAEEAIKKGGRRPKLPEFPVKNADGSLTDYGKWYYERPSGLQKRC